MYARGASLAPRAAKPPPPSSAIQRATGESILEAGRVTAGGGRRMTDATLKHSECLKNVTLL